jgi:hypothetical protein
MIRQGGPTNADAGAAKEPLGVRVDRPREEPIVSQVRSELGGYLSSGVLRPDGKGVFSFGAIVDEAGKLVKITTDLAPALLDRSYGSTVMLGRFNPQTRGFTVLGLEAGYRSGAVDELPEGRFADLKKLVGLSGTAPPPVDIRAILEANRPKPSPPAAPLSPEEDARLQYQSALSEIIFPRSSGEFGMGQVLLKWDSDHGITLGRSAGLLAPFDGKRTIRQALSDPGTSPDQLRALWAYGMGTREAAKNDADPVYLTGHDRKGRAIVMRAAAAGIARGMAPEDFGDSAKGYRDAFSLDLAKPYVPEDQKDAIRAALAKLPPT